MTRHIAILRQLEETLTSKSAPEGDKSTVSKTCTQEGWWDWPTRRFAGSGTACFDSSSSDDENTPPNVRSQPKDDGGSDSGSFQLDSSSSSPLWFSPSKVTVDLDPTPADPHTKTARASPSSYIKTGRASPPPHTKTGRPSPPSPDNLCASPTTSSPVLLDTPPRKMPSLKSRKTREGERRTRQAHAAPYSRHRQTPDRPTHHIVNPQGSMGTTKIAPTERQPTRLEDDIFVPARWPHSVAHLRDQFNPLATVFPAVSHYGSCGCSSPCRVDICRNSLMDLYCNINCCPYAGECGNGLAESNKVYLGRNLRTHALGVVAAEPIEAGEVLGQYLEEMEHVSMARDGRQRNGGYRLVIKQRPEKPSYPG